MRKKIVTLMLSFAMVLSLAACGGNAKDDSSSSAKTETSESADEEKDEEADASDAADTEADTSDDAADESEAGNTDADSSETDDDLMSVLGQLDILEVGDIVGTEWGMSGGIVNGVELDQEQYDASLEQYGGTMNVVFDDETNISMVQGGGTLKGTYAPMPEDDHGMEIVFDNNGTELKYAGLFANVDGTKVLMLFSDATGQNAIYFTQN